MEYRRGDGRGLDGEVEPDGELDPEDEVKPSDGVGSSDRVRVDTKRIGLD